MVFFIEQDRKEDNWKHPDNQDRQEDYFGIVYMCTIRAFRGVFFDVFDSSNASP